MYIIKYMMSIYPLNMIMIKYPQQRKKSIQQQTYLPLQTIGQWLPNSYM